MKIIFTLLLIAFTLLTNAQWNMVYSDPSKNLVDIQFTSPDTGYVIGDNGVNAFLLKTIDGGLNWTESALPIPFVNKLYFLTNDRGYVIKGGVPVQLLKTINGGASWTSFPLDSSFTVMDLAMFNDSTGLYMNNGGRLRKIVASGMSYFYLSDTCDGETIVVTDPLTGYISAPDAVLKTINKGVSWNILPTGLLNDVYPYTMTFASNTKGYLATRDLSGAGEIFTTINGATSWTSAYNFNAVNIHSRNNNCIAVNDTGKIAISSNSGATWNDESLPVSYIGIETFFCHVSPADEGFIINGNAGQIFKRTGELSTSEIEKNELEVNVYPNPVTSILNLKIPSSILYKIEITDAFGRVVLVSQNESIINVTNIPDGFYLLHIKVNDDSGSVRLIKN